MQLFAPLALGQHMDVVGRAAALPAIERVGLPVLLGQCGFHKGGGGPQQGRDPHPEHRPRPAGKDGGGHPHKVAGADGGRQRGAQALELADGLFLAGGMGGDAPVGPG